MVGMNKRLMEHGGIPPKLLPFPQHFRFFFWLSLLLFVCAPQLSWGNGVSPTVLILPKGPGSIGGVGENVKANLNMGLMSYAIPIKLPSGRRSFSPQLSINYSSSGGAGVVGIGWKLNGADSVERLTVRGLPRYGSIQDPALKGEDRFYSPMGELVQMPGTVFYRVRREGGFVRFRWHQKDAQQGYWTAEFPDGSINYYGAAYTPNASHKVDVTQAKVDLESHVRGALGTFRWRLRSRVDASGNRIEYKYFRDGNQLYLTSIEWVFSKEGKALYRANIVYETRPDPIFDGKAGFPCTTTRRVKEINILSTGQPFRSYRLTYDSKSRLSRLLRVVEYGTDGKTPFPVQFSMAYSSAQYDASRAMIKQLSKSVAQDFTTRNSDLIDMNGDGLPDIVNTAEARHTFHFNELTVTPQLKQDQHNFSAPKANPANTSAKLSNDEVQMLDVNGDGFTDLVDASNKKIYINKGKGQWEDQSQSLLGQFPNPSSKAPNRRFFDYNGDKAIDIIEINGETVTYWVADGKGSWSAVTGKQSLGADFAKDKLRLIDINGDGLFDAVQFIGSKMRYRTYFGYGKWSDWIEVEVTGLTPELTDRARFRDLNGDGLADMVAFVANAVTFFVNLDGKSFAPGVNLNSKFKGVDLPDSDPQRVSIRIADINGNGSRDIVWLDSSGKITYLELFGQRPNLLTHIDNGIGKKIEVTYGSSVFHALRDKAAGTPWPSKLPMPFIVVNQIKTWAAMDKDDPSKGCPEIQNIAYHDGFYDGFEKKFRGFRRVESTIVGDTGPNCPTSLGSRTEKLRFYVGDGDTANGDNISDYHGKMRESATTGVDSTGKTITFSSTKMTWGECPLTAVDTNTSPVVRFICLQAQEQILQEGKSQEAWKTLRTEYEYDGFGNVTLTKELGVKDTKGDEKFTKMTYTKPADPLSSSPDSRWFLRAPVKKEICETAQGPCATTLFFYDGEPFKGLPEGQITRGLPTRSTAKPSENADPINLSRTEYDEYGNIIGTMTPTGGKRVVTWDSEYKRFPETEVVELKGYKLTSSTRWDIRFAQVVQSKDWNDHSVFYGYDVFGRLTSTTEPGDPSDQPSVVYSYKLSTPLSTITAKRRATKGGPFDLTNIQCFDGMGRLVQTRAQIDENTYLVAKHIQFNSAGQFAKRYNTYTSKEAGCSFQAPDNVPFMSYKFDSLGRLAEATNQEKGTIKYVYEPLKKTTFDEEDLKQGSPHENTPTIEEFDGLGRLLKRTTFEKAGSPTENRFTWSFLNIKGQDIMVDAIDRSQKSKKQTIDLLGRVIETTDPDRGLIRYTFDASGNLLKRTDASGQSVVYTYDVLNRMLTVQQEGKADTLISYHYDQAFGTFANATNLKARLAGMSYPGGELAFGYDKRGNVTGTRRMLLGTPFVFTNTYDNAERLVKRTYPDGRSLSFRYDRSNRLLGIDGLIKETTYGTHGFTDSWTLANGVKTNIELDGRLQLKRLVVADGRIIDNQYSYDDNGNILTLSKKVGGVSSEQTFVYDSLYRLKQARLGAQETLRYSYQPNGTILTKESSLGNKSSAHVGTYTYEPAHPKAVQQAGSLSLKYNKVGAAIQIQDRQYENDFLDRRTAVTVGGKVVSRYWYDGQARRLIKQEFGRHTLYVARDYEIRDGAAVIYGFMGKTRVAAWKSTKGLAALYDDVAPAGGDGKIDVQDAWKAHLAYKAGDGSLRKRPIEVNLVNDMLQASVTRLLNEDKDEKVYFHNNHLSSTVAVTNQEGELISQKSYYPFGAIREQSGKVFSYGFIGTERDKATFENYAHHRYLHTRLGRWTSADPLFETVRGTNDESNSYGYVLNNPLRYRDSSGTEAESGDIVLAVFGTTAGILAVGVAALAIRHEYKKQANGMVAKTYGKVAGAVKLIGGGLAPLLGGISLYAEDDSKAKLALQIAAGLSLVATLIAAGVREKHDFNRFNGVLQTRDNAGRVPSLERTVDAARKDLMKSNKDITSYKKKERAGKKRVRSLERKVSQLKHQLSKRGSFKSTKSGGSSKSLRLSKPK